ncbi:MAG: S8 family serine peptidase [Patescibacteria group bacterium]
MEKRKITFLTFVFLLLGLFVTVWTVKNSYFDTRKKAIEVPLDQRSKFPEHKEGELLLKFKETPKGLETFSQKYQIKTTEKVFDDTILFRKGLGKSKAKPKRELQTDGLSRIYKVTFNKEVPVVEMAEKLASDPVVEYVEPNYIFHTQATPDDFYFLDHYPDNVGNRDPEWNPPYDYQWNLKIIDNIEGAWDSTTGSSGVVVAVVDSGIDYTHEELGGCTLQQVNDNQCARFVPGYDFVNDDNNPADDHGHGTHVAGIITSVSNNGQGIAGINWEAKLMPVKTFSAGGAGFSDTNASGIVFAANNGAQVINMSWGNNIPTPDISLVLKDALDYAFSLNVVLVAAAGNSNDEVADGYWPANYKYVISVAATNEDNQRSSYSNFGKVDLAAPGGNRSPYNLLSLNAHNPSNSSSYLNLGGLPVGNGYLRLAGTSMAAPHVAGLVALALSLDPSLTNLETKSLLEFSSTQLGPSVFDKNYGWGRIAAFETISNLVANRLPPVAEIYSPHRNEGITGQYSIIGTANARNFQNYSVKVGVGENPSEWSTDCVVLANGGAVPVTNGLLATLDVTGFQDQQITVVLEVIDQVGLKKEEWVSVHTFFLDFGENVQVNSNSTSPYTPDGAFGSQGDYYAVWTDTQSQHNFSKVFFAKSTDNGNSFSADFPISDSSSEYAFYPSITVVNEDLFVVYENLESSDLEAPGADLVVRRSSNRGTSFQTVATLDISNLTKPPFAARFLEAKVTGHEGKLYLTWQAGQVSDNNHVQVYFARFDTQSNTFEVVDSLRTATIDLNFSFPPQPTIVVDNNGVVYIAWTEMVNNVYKVLLVKSTNGGQDFDEPQELFDQQYEHQVFPALGMGEDGQTIYLTFAAQTPIDWARDVWASKSSDGVQFSAPYNITQGNWENPFRAAYYQSPVASNRAGDVFVVWQDVGSNQEFISKVDSSFISSSPPFVVGNTSIKTSLVPALTGSIFALYDSPGKIMSRRIGQMANPSVSPTPSPIPTIPLPPPNPQCGDVIPTPWGSLYAGSVFINNQPAPVGTQVFVLNPRGQIVGCKITNISGIYPYVKVYGEDPTCCPGMRDGEPITFYVNGVLASTSPSGPHIWHDGWEDHRVDLYISSPNPGFGQAIRFDPGVGDTCSYLEIPASDNLLMGENLTIEAWFKPDESILNQGGSGLFSLLAKEGLSGGGHGGYSLYLSQPKTVHGFFHLQEPGGDYFGLQELIGGDNILSFNWHFLKLTKSANQFKMFVDGQLVKELVVSAGGLLTEQLINPFFIGAWRPAGQTQCFSNYVGLIDEIRISDIERDYFGIPTAPFTTDANTLALWHFDGNPDDSSGNDHGGVEMGVVQYPAHTTIPPVIPAPTFTPTPTPPAPTPTTSTAVFLTSFTATLQSDQVLLEWETAMEMENAGFNLYRADSVNEQRTKLNSSIISGQPPGSVTGGSYSFVDTNVVSGETYYYWVEDVDLGGITTFHGPENISVPVITPNLTATLTPVPTPTPVPTNSVPSIITQRLVTTRRFQPYKVSIVAVDPDGDDLSMVIEKLPLLFARKKCTRLRAGRLVCQIKGIPYRVGRYPVKIMAKDSFGTETTKILFLTVLDRKR